MASHPQAPALGTRMKSLQHDKVPHMTGRSCSGSVIVFAPLDRRERRTVFEPRHRAISFLAVKLRWSRWASTLERRESVGPGRQLACESGNANGARRYPPDIRERAPPRVVMETDVDPGRTGDASRERPGHPVIKPRRGGRGLPPSSARADHMTSATVARRRLLDRRQRLLGGIEPDRPTRIRLCAVTSRVAAATFPGGAPSQNREQGGRCPTTIYVI